MRNHIVLILLFLVTISLENKLHKAGKVEFTPEDFEGMLNAFLNGIRIEQISESTLPCKNSLHQFVVVGAQAVEDIMNDEAWVGTLSLADALAITPPVARNCTKGVDELSTQIYAYISSITSFEQWITQIKDNVSSNFAKLTVLSSELVAEWTQKETNFTKVGGTLGEMAYYTFTFNSTTQNIVYRRGDPLAPAPMNEVAWIIIESFYEFFTNARLANETTVNNCQNSAANMLLFHFDAYNNIKGSNVQEGIFLILDSFIFLRPSLENCAATTFEIIDNFEVVYNRIAENPEQIRKNFEQNLFHIVSGSAATYAQIYHRDIISLHRVFGGLVYNTLVRV